VQQRSILQPMQQVISIDSKEIKLDEMARMIGPLASQEVKK